MLTEADDFHAYRIRHALRERGHSCRIIESNRLSGRGRLSWTAPADESSAVVYDIEEEPVALGDLDLIWCRRVHAPAVVPEHVRDPAARAVIDRNTAAALEGALHSDFDGAWVSGWRETRAAELKLVQLRAAQAAGLRVPQTLVSQDPERVRAFCEELQYEVVVKSVAGSRTTPTMTGRVTPDILTDDAITLSPAIYQELVPGTRHLRVCCFGDKAYAALLESDRLDWRYPHDFQAQPTELDAETASKLVRVLELLNLRMGIFDLKPQQADEAIWLEVNPQGQFLFLEGMTGMPLTTAFTDFLVREAEAHARRRTSDSRPAAAGLSTPGPGAPRSGRRG